MTALAAGRYHASVTSRSAAPARAPRCPTCGAAIPWSGNPQRPFCSLTCRLIDLGSWLDERYRVAGEALGDDGDPEAPAPSRHLVRSDE